MFTELLAKWFGPAFLLKHRTTLAVFIAGLLTRLPIPLPDAIKEQFSGTSADIIILIIAYLMSFKIDLGKKA